MNIGMFEIFNYIVSQCQTKDELAEEINDLIMATDRSKFSIQLNDYWEEYCETNNICVCCGATLEVEECNDTEIIEYQGFPCKQILYEKYCPNCDK